LEDIIFATGTVRPRYYWLWGYREWSGRHIFLKFKNDRKWWNNK